MTIKLVHRCCLYFCLGLLVGPVWAQSTPLNKKQDQLHKLFEQHLANISAPGFSVIVAQGNNIIFANGYGIERVGDSAPFTPETIVGIGSLTKSFTAMMILQLRDAGRLNLDDPIIKYLPWFRAADKSQSDKITIRMLLNMTSGLEQHLFRLLRHQSIDNDAIEQGVRRLSSYQIITPPGESFRYINEGWNILGLVIEEITGQSWEKALSEQVLTPLDMRSTSADRDWLLAHDINYGHYAGITPKPANFTYIKNSLPSGAGLYSNTNDLAKYLIELLADDDTSRFNFLSKQSRQEMWHPAVTMPILPHELGGNNKQGAYAMGWMRLAIDNIDYVFHGGEFRVSSSLMLINPAAQTGIVILYNTGDLDPYRNESKIFVAHNALRVLESLPPSTFGKPRQQDPSLNTYTPSFAMDNFWGTYIAKSGRRIEVLPGGSEGLIFEYADGIYPETFDIDFANPTAFVARSIAHSNVGYFQQNNGSSVQAINILGESFQRLQTSKSGQIQHQLKALGVEFTLPSEWSLLEQSNSFIATLTDSPETAFSGQRINADYTHWLNVAQQQAKVETPFIQATDFINGRFVHYAVYWTSDDRKTIAAFCQCEGQNYVFKLEAEESMITLLALDSIVSVLRTLRVTINNDSR